MWNSSSFLRNHKTSVQRSKIAQEPKIRPHSPLTPQTWLTAPRRMSTWGVSPPHTATELGWRSPELDRHPLCATRTSGPGPALSEEEGEHCSQVRPAGAVLASALAQLPVRRRRNSALPWLSLGSSSSLAMPTSLGEPLLPGLVPAHLNNDIPLPLPPPQKCLPGTLSLKLTLASTLDPTEHPSGSGRHLSLEELV